MTDRPPEWPSEGSPGCIPAIFASVILVVVAPFAMLVQSWRTWRRGSDLRLDIEVGDCSRPGFARVDATWDVPRPHQSGFRRRLTDGAVRVAEALRSADDVYHLVYRLPTDPEPMTLPVGPLLQEFGERFFLVLGQGALEGRTAVWLTLPRGRALAEILDPSNYDPEVEGEPDGLLEHEGARWSMASEWAMVGPSLVVRLILMVPADRAGRVRDLLSRVC